MPAGADEAIWNRAKGQAEKQGKGENYPYVMSIYKSMSGQKKTAGLREMASNIFTKAQGLGSTASKNVGRDITTGAVERLKEIFMKNRGKIIGAGAATAGGLTLVDVARSKFLANEIAKKMNSYNEKTATILNSFSKLGGFGPHSYSSTQIQMPSEIAKAIKAQGLQIPDKDLYIGEDDPDKDAWNGYGRESDFHVTVKYGLHTAKSGDVSDLLSGEKPIRAKIGKISLFEQDDHDVVKFDIVSDDLHRLNKKISDSLEHTTTFPDYKPHATIAYVKKGKGKDLVGNASVTGKEFTVDEIIFSSKDGKRASIKLTGKEDAEKTAARKTSPFRIKGNTPGTLRRVKNLQKGHTRGKKKKIETPLVDGISKASSIPFSTGAKIGLGGIATGAIGYKFGWPWFKNKYMGVQPSTVEKYRVVR